MEFVLPPWPGLRKRLFDAGVRLEVLSRDGGAPELRVSDRPLAEAIIAAWTREEEAAFTRAAIEAHAKRLRDQVVASISWGEGAAWSIKQREAAAYAVSGNAADAPLLGMEADVRRMALPELVAKVLTNAQALSLLEAVIAGTAGRHGDAVAALTSCAAVAAYDWTTGWPAL